ncbi:Autoinducer 2 sensor kinase/phosphatase LuxQ [Andreprevotia sp. IGB-42]|uniref:hybrid sensor histidine kinase/response regulator n=1 Tax=Andreprevotia sp. IGB-42 TaxID=2497473 RepID=UPI001356F3D7|nr:hybrid sensor histidine kinase/response regulator [Andreprevotia sp. IGB-42]KAF0813375.1 Autoinducer 2 sensor kinase/phosphatase LuxQ [Andreprevotia sp. IGB-42]
MEPVEKVHLLLVDDLVENLIALEALIKRNDVIIHKATSGIQGLELMLEHDFALALVDVRMPGMNGFELAELMRGTEKTKHIPIVFVSAGGKELNYAFKGYESGAVDFLHKPLDVHAVRSKVNVFIQLHCQKREMRQQLEALQRSKAEQEQLLKELRKTQDELEEAIRVRDNFMSIASHELKTPLSSLKLQTQMRARHVERGNDDAFSIPKVRKMVETDAHLIDNIVNLIDDMLDVTRIRGGKLSMQPVRFDLAELTKTVVERFHEQLVCANGSYELVLESAAWGIWDIQRIEQVITNLLTNAMRYGAHKPVRIEVRRLPDGVAQLLVQDNGIGIAKANQDRIFRVFERANNDNTAGGLGLGLYIVGQIVDGHGGRIRVESDEGAGATFIVELPEIPAQTGVARLS